MIKQQALGRTRKAWISILFGIISLILAPYGLVANLGEIQINLPWSLIFPIAVALAFGWRFALLAGLFGGALFPFLLWPNDGWSNVFTSLIFLGFYVLLGIAIERKYFKKLQNISFRIILAFLVFIIISSFYYIFLFNRILALNPPFWEPDAIKHIPLKVLYGIAFKDSINILILVLAAETLIRLNTVQKILSLNHEPKMQKNSALFVGTILVSLIVWLISTFLRVVLDDGKYRFQDHQNSIELFVIIASGFVVARLLFYYNENQFNFQNELKKSEEKFKALFEFANDAILIIYDGTIIDCNVAALQVFECEFDHIIGKTPGFLSPIHQPDGMLSTEKAKHWIDKALFDSYQQFEWIHQRSNGTPFETEISLNKIEINGELLIQAIVKDITERKQSEHLLQEQRDLSIALSKTSTLDVGLQLCLESAMHISGMDCGGFYLVDPLSGTLNLAYHQGLPHAVIQSTSKLEANTPQYQLIQAGQPIYTEHLTLNIPIDQVRKEEHLRAIAIIPILHEGRVISCMNIASHTLNVVPEYARNMLEQITRQIGQVIVRLRTEEALKENEKKYRLLAENIPGVIWVRNLKTNQFTYVSPSNQHLSGYSAEELMTEGFYEKIPNQTENFIAAQKAIYAEVNRVAKMPNTNKQSQFEYQMPHKNGAQNWVKTVINIINDIEGTPSELVGVSINIEERKKAEEALFESETKYRELVENLNDVIYTVGSNGIISFVSAPVKILSEYEPEELIGESLFKLIHQEDAAYIARGFSEVLNGRILPREYRILSKTGKVKWVRSSSRPITNGKTTIGVQGVISDITELKRSEHELIHAKEKAEESDRLKTSFLQNLSHEIRTPLNSIMGFASLLPDEESKKLIDSYSSIIVENSEQLVHIIDDIVLYSRLQSRQISNISKEFEVNNMLTNIQQSFNLPEFQKGVNLVIESCLNETYKINSDYEKIRQVYTNLISNAYKYTRKGTITFGLKDSEQELLFFVRDTGIGIPKNEVDHIFERFYRATNVDKGVIGGTGLGLSIVAELMELLGGKIWVESEMGKGSTFIFTIPASTTV
ncbi:MAG: PAS domain S-box protein [Prolixibacteraceae bacterium]